MQKTQVTMVGCMSRKPQSNIIQKRMILERDDCKRVVEEGS